MPPVGFEPTISAGERPTTTEGKPEAATTIVVAPDDGHEDARNMLNCI